MLDEWCRASEFFEPIIYDNQFIDPGGCLAPSISSYNKNRSAGLGYDTTIGSTSAVLENPSLARVATAHHACSRMAYNDPKNNSSRNRGAP